MAGFLAHLMTPFSSQAQKKAFTRWLDHNVVASGNENEIKLRNTIKALPEQNGDFWLLIQEASELVANHGDEFRFHVSNNGQKDHQRISIILVDQWNTFQNQKLGFNSILTESIKTLSGWTSQSGFFPFIGNFPNRILYLYQTKEIFSFEKAVYRILIPLISSISINAP